MRRWPLGYWQNAAFGVEGHNAKLFGSAGAFGGLQGLGIANPKSETLDPKLFRVQRPFFLCSTFRLRELAVGHTPSLGSLRQEESVTMQYLYTHTHTHACMHACIQPLNPKLSRLRGRGLPLSFRQFRYASSTTSPSTLRLRGVAAM